MKKILLVLFAAAVLFGRPIGLQAQEQDTVMWMIFKMPGFLQGVSSEAALVPASQCNKLASKNAESLLSTHCVPLAEYCANIDRLAKQYNATALCRDNKLI